MKSSLNKAKLRGMRFIARFYVAKEKQTTNTSNKVQLIGNLGAKVELKTL